MRLSAHRASTGYGLAIAKHHERWEVARWEAGT